MTGYRGDKAYPTVGSDQHMINGSRPRGRFYTVNARKNT